MKDNRFEMEIHGLSEDMEDFICEQCVFYEENPTKFWTSFYKTCCDMWQNGIDLSDKQLNIIYREYNKVKEKRMKNYNIKKHKHDLEVLWNGFDGWTLVRCKDMDCDYLEHLFRGKEIK